MAEIPGQPIIQLSGVEKTFSLPRSLGQLLRHPLTPKRIDVLKGVSFEVPLGSATGLLGPNGSGKTTLLRLLATTVLPDRGAVRLFGQDVTHAPQSLKKRIGFVLSDERSFYWRLTARQNLTFFGVLQEMDEANIRARIHTLAELLRIQDELDKPFRDLSTGMRQRLALIRALLHDPELLLVDEPTRGLDPGAARRFQRTLHELLVGRWRKTLLLASHNLEEIRAVCDRVVLLKDGRVLAQGATEATLTHLPEVFELDEPKLPEGGEEPPA